MKYIVKNIPLIFTVILLLVLAATMLFMNLSTDEDHYIVAEATEIKIKDIPAANVDTNRLHDALSEMYGIRIYSAKTDIPQYFQTDYDHVPFSGETIAESGCGITCLSMIVEYLLDETILPDEMAERYECGSNAAAAMEKGIRALNLNCEKYYGNAMYEEFREAVKNDHPVIILVRSPSEFTTGGHFMVVTGMTEDGKYIINDPNRKNYDKQSLADGYKTGFTEKEIFKSLNGVYIFDKRENETAKESVLSVYRNVLKESETGGC